MDVSHKSVAIEVGQKHFTIGTLESDLVSEVLLQTNEFYEADYLQELGTLLQPGDLVLDIGAHIGNHSLFFTGVSGARVVAFEPNPATFDMMRQTILANGLKDQLSAHNIALSGQDDDSVILTPLPSLDPGSMSVKREQTSASIKRPAKTLNSFFEYFEARPIKLIKIDVEGSEVDIIKGGLRVINLNKPTIGVEVSSVEAFDELDAMLTPMRYHPVSIHNATPTVIWRADVPPTNRDVFQYAVRMAVKANRSSAKLKDLIESDDTNIKDEGQAAKDDTVKTVAIASASEDSAVAKVEKVVPTVPAHADVEKPSPVEITIADKVAASQSMAPNSDVADRPDKSSEASAKPLDAEKPPKTNS